jgi:hypothetical protein
MGQMPASQGPPLLNTSEQSQLSNFFNHPELFETSKFIGFGYYAEDTSISHSTSTNPALAAHASSLQSAHVSGDHMHGGNMASYDENGQSSLNFLSQSDYNAASTLNNFRNPTEANPPPPGIPAWWGDMPMELNLNNINMGYATNFPNNQQPGANGNHQSPIPHTGMQWFHLVDAHRQKKERPESLFDLAMNQKHQNTHTRPPIPHFGSDSNFSGSHYRAALPLTDHEVKSTNLLGVPLAEQASGYSPNAAAQGPVMMARNNPMSAPFGDSPYSQQTHGLSFAVQPMRKRRRSQVDETGFAPNGVKQEADSDDEGVNGPYKRPQLNHPLYQQNEMQFGEEDEETRRRRSIKKKENLSDQQKRANHIQSEKKRREIINKGYADLNMLVPCLANGKSGLSRSECLAEIHCYLETVTRGNEAILASLNLTAEDLSKVAAPVEKDQPS